MNRVFIINKPKGFTSQDAVSKFKKIMQIKKAGHTGTLDPLATGVLPILTNECTKLSKYLVEHNKEYIATIELGVQTSTGDSEGEIIDKKPVDDNIFDYDINNINKESILYKATQSFIGTIEQTPPIYSAIKVNGKKLYQYARNSENVTIPKRQITIYDINVINVNKEQKQVTIKVNCSTGTYIRTLCEDIAKALNTDGFTKELIRTKVDVFDLENAVTFEELEANKENSNWIIENSFSMEDVMKDYPRLELDNSQKDLFINGTQIKTNLSDNTYNIYIQNEYIGLGIVSKNLLKRDVIL